MAGGDAPDRFARSGHGGLPWSASGALQFDTVTITRAVRNTPPLDTVSSSGPRQRIFDAAWNLIVVRGDAGFTMAQIAKQARISRQALYLHFADRAALLDALVSYVDHKRGLARAIQRIIDAPDGREAIRRMVSLQATQNSRVWAIARAFEAVRRTDKAAQRSWQKRQARRLDVCGAIVGQLRREGHLRRTLTVAEATDLLYVITSLRMWEALVLVRGWTAASYQARITRLLMESLTTTDSRGGRRAR
jgi:AcrR family transcriptional regulator